MEERERDRENDEPAGGAQAGESVLGSCSPRDLLIEPAATAAILDRSASVFPSVTDRKIGMFPIGFMIAKSAANAFATSPQSTRSPPLQARAQASLPDPLRD